ncbi:MAG: clostripain-related cysteine peptidase [Armatimonadota bacterium]
MKHNFILIIVFSVIITSIIGCGGGGGGSSSPSLTTLLSVEEAKQHGKWTILVYLNADNDLESSGIHNMNQMESIGSTRDVRIVVQMDRINGYDTSNGNWTDTRRFLIIRDNNPNLITSPRLDESNPLGELDMGSEQTLLDFVQWGMNEFPADHYALVIWDHGTGWQIRTLSLENQKKAISYDDTSGSAININKIADVFDGKGIDIIAFDACFMMQLEVAYELKNSARYMIGAPSTEPAPGYNYARILSRINANTTPMQLSRIIVEEYYSEYSNRRAISLTAVDLNRMNSVSTALENFVQAISQNAAGKYSQYNQARIDSLNYSTIDGGFQRHSLDLLDYAQRCAVISGDAAISAYSNLEAVLNNAIVAKRYSSDLVNATGMSIYIPSPDRFDNRYEILKLSNDTSWNEWLQWQGQ